MRMGDTVQSITTADHMPTNVIVFLAMYALQVMCTNPPFCDQSIAWGLLLLGWRLLLLDMLLQLQHWPGPLQPVGPVQLQPAAPWLQFGPALKTVIMSDSWCVILSSSHVYFCHLLYHCYTAAVSAACACCITNFTLMYLFEPLSTFSAAEAGTKTCVDKDSCCISYKEQFFVCM